MSSLFNIAAGGQAGFYGYQINDSLRFDDGSSSRLAPTSNFGTPTNTDIATISVWVKRGNLSGVNQEIVGGYDGSSGTSSSIYFDTSNRLHVAFGGGSGALTTNAVFRDTSSWYHIHVLFDSTQSTSTDRCKIYVNGQQITSFSSSSYPNQNQDNHMFSSGANHRIGSNFNNSGNFFDGYMAEFNGIDGTALDPTNFGETKSGVWIPKDTSGLTFGNNGFRLEFGNSLAIGDDTSGNTNDWTATNLSAHDVVPDSPTNNFSTLNSLAFLTFAASEGNLSATTGNSLSVGSSTMACNAGGGKFYFEARGTSVGNGTAVGIVKSSVGGTRNYTYAQTAAIYYTAASGAIYSTIAGATQATGASFTAGDVIGVAVDGENGTVEFFKNGVSQGSASESTIATEDYLAYVLNASTSGSTAIRYNFGQDSTFAELETAATNADENGFGQFHHSVPSGFLAMCTANFTEPSITPLDDELPEDYFDTRLYTGNGNSGHVIDGIQTNPDFTWIKDRNVAKAHMLFDSLRGDGTNLYPLSSDGTGQERTDLSRLILGDGQFEIDVTESSVNANNQSYVSWNWQAGGTAVSNTDGSVTSSVSVNTKAGFSIATYTEPSGSFSFGHGLGVTPDMFIFKRRNGTENWIVWQKDFGSPTKNGVYLNDDGGQFTTGSNWLTAIDSDTISITSGQVGSAGTKVCYAFKGIEGYSKFGKYTGNGSTDGTFVYTGFRPAFVMIKNTSSSAGWHMYDSVRGTTVGNEPTLNANSAGTESSSGDRIDFTSNGFKLKINQTNVNLSGNNYIYMAFAEMPFKYANAV